MSMTEEVKIGQRLPKPYAFELMHRQLAKPWPVRGIDRDTIIYLQAVTALWASSAMPEGMSLLLNRPTPVHVVEGQGG